MQYIYIDESGESKFLIFASIATTNARALEKAVKKIWKAKPHLHAQGELHAHSVEESTKRRVLLTLMGLDISIRYKAVKKREGNMSFIDLYYIQLAEFIKDHPKSHVIVVDKRDTNSKRRRQRINQ